MNAATSQGPVELMREPAPTAPAPWPATEWWVVAPVVLVGLAVLLTLQVRWIRARRLSDSERAFRRLASAQRLRPGDRVLVRQLAAAHEGATPVALLMSDHALARAAEMIEAKPESSTDRALRSFLERRGLAARA